MSDLTTLALAGKLAQNAEPTKKNATIGFPTGDGYAMEPKYDGWRILAHIGEDRVDFYSRTGKTYNGKLPKVEAELLANFPAGTWLDGEAVAITLDGDKVLNEWSVVQSVLTKMGGSGAVADKVTYMVFDLLAHRGIDARSLGYADRRLLMERAFAKGDFNAVALSTIHEASADTHDALVKAGYEGSIVKRLNAGYRSGQRGHGWSKVKSVVSVEGVVMGFKEGENGFTGLVGAVVFGQHDDDGTLIERGRCSGMSMRTRIDMSNNRDVWLGRVIEVKHMGVSIGEGESGRFRHPQFARRRDDKVAGMVAWHDA